MGREIRRVPIDWEHPKHDWRNGYQPMHDSDFETAAREWMDDYSLWGEGKHPDQPRPTPCYYWEWAGDPPDKEYHRPAWPEGTAVAYQLYETVSEGTPVSPVFATLEGLAKYLAEKGDYWDQNRGNGGMGMERALAFVSSGGWAPSKVVSSAAGVVDGKTAMADMAIESKEEGKQ